MTRIHGLKQIKSLRPAHFAHDNPLGAHTQTVFNQVAHRDRTHTFQIGRAGFQPHHMWLLQLQFGGILAGNNPFIGINIIGQTVEQSGFA